jgi:hypothetical protein
VKSVGNTTREATITGVIFAPVQRNTNNITVIVGTARTADITGFTALNIPVDLHITAQPKAHIYDTTNDNDPRKNVFIRRKGKSSEGKSSKARISESAGDGNNTGLAYTADAIHHTATAAATPVSGINVFIILLALPFSLFINLYFFPYYQSP